MRTRVKPHEEIKPLIRKWRRTLSDDPQRRRDLAMVFWAELERRIIAAKGPPAGAVKDDSTKPPTYWCELSGGWWAQLVVLPDRRTGVFTFEREVVVINLVSRPPG
jgi:hypothetical protein